MDLGQILDAKNRSSADLANLIPAPTYPDSNGDYILPVPFAPLQKELMNSVVTAHYSDILAFFDAGEDSQRAQRSVQNLQKMKESLHELAVHPFLLIEHYLPNNLLSREAPHYLAEVSGTFDVLGMLVRAASELKLQVAVVSQAGKTADLLDAFFCDKPVNFYRYSGAPLKEPRPPKPNLSTFHLVPSNLRDLTAAINAAFDFMLVVDETFDSNSDYASGLRAQLRDPSLRAPLAPIVRLVPLDSISHASTLGRSFSDSLAAAITLKDKAGQIPRELQPLYDHALLPLVPWLQYADSAWVLPRPALLRHYGKAEVERALMLDTGGSYAGPSKADSLATNGTVKRPVLESGEPRAKRLKVEFDYAPLKDKSLSYIVLEKYNHLLKVSDTRLQELETLRDSASARETELEKITNEMATFVKENRKLTRQADVHAEQVAKLRADKESLVEASRSADERWEEVKAGLISDSIEEKYFNQSKKVEELEVKLKQADEKLSAKDKELEYMRGLYQTASASAGENAAELRTVEADRDAFKIQAEGQMVRLRELTVQEEARTKNLLIAELTAEIQNYKTTIRSVLETERGTSTRDRSRYNNRAQSVQVTRRGDSRAVSPA